MAKLFWTIQEDIQHFWRYADEVPVRAYRLIGRYRRDLEQGGYLAERMRPPAVFPVCRRFDSKSDAKQWVIET